MEDDVIRGATVIKQGEVTWPPPPPKVQAIAPAAAAVPAPASVAAPEPKSKGTGTLISLIVGALLLALIGAYAPPAFMQHFTVFVLAIFVGFQVVWNVAPSLHTPLMSVTNAISGIIVIGALLQIGSPSTVVALLAGIAVLVATVNIAGGFWVTQRMLKMFRKE
jgi:proton-translocating NAD(P)+ transhydrogenase subunit alpha